jgi:hypothetical protein
MGLIDIEKTILLSPEERNRGARMPAGMPLCSCQMDAK